MSLNDSSTKWAYKNERHINSEETENRKDSISGSLYSKSKLVFTHVDTLVQIEAKVVQKASSTILNNIIACTSAADHENELVLQAISFSSQRQNKICMSATLLKRTLLFKLAQPRQNDWIWNSKKQFVYKTCPHDKTNGSVGCQLNDQTLWWLSRTKDTFEIWKSAYSSQRSGNDR